jgi:hypothetical protein
MHWLSALRRRVGRVPGVRRFYGLALHAAFAIDLRTARRRERSWRPRDPRPAARLNVVILSYARPRNIQPIAESVLRCDFVERLVIVNNQPRTRLEDYVRIASPRLTILHPETPGLPGRRFEIARDLPGEYFLAIDDDTLLRAEQIEALFRALIADPAVPHGVIGQVIHSPVEQQAVLPFRLVERGDARVDILNRVYLFTVAHVDRFFSLFVAIGDLTPERGPLGLADDLILSFSGSSHPRIHDVGRVLYFPSSDDPTIACWLQPGFHEHRHGVYRDLVAVTARPTLAEAPEAHSMRMRGPSTRNK